ncbi:DUF6544 family protein [Actinophytocola sp.]|uniref:DUF6544 family protein n=1 Tax=Actinophytocola sp. TaxID=1872138 RepID=UPI002D7E3453|nr:DUF6544 family protein [Actinophytocola sp.]HET9139927.1 DUF6544 family protein [Actinophytocola sp.]
MTEADLANLRLGWMPAQAWRYNSSLETARIFLMRLRFAHVLPMIGRDTYLRGRGHMLGKLLDRFVVAAGGELAPETVHSGSMAGPAHGWRSRAGVPLVPVVAGWAVAY